MKTKKLECVCEFILEGINCIIKHNEDKCEFLLKYEINTDKYSQPEILREVYEHIFNKSDKICEECEESKLLNEINNSLKDYFNFKNNEEIIDEILIKEMDENTYNSIKIKLKNRNIYKPTFY